ncbi:MAG TPA: xylose isomerase [Anaeromyxobacter sp.]|nr:xylose isomerase [Anaeromyxobacter sp.]
MPSYFAEIPSIPFEGPNSQNPLAYRYYQKDRMVLGKRMEDQLRFAVAYWHTFCGKGVDVFGVDGSIDRPWFHGDPMQAARLKAESALEFVAKLGVPFYCFHDLDIAPEGATPRETQKNVQAMVEELAKLQQKAGVKLLWGTANLFSHRRFTAGAATNPNPELFAMAATQVKGAMDATLKLGGVNYVLWGGREGYEAFLNTDVKAELDQLGRFLNMVVEYKHKIGFKGTILIEPKPCEPTKHQYDFDTATVYGLLCRCGLDKEIKVNIENNHATLAGHTFEHEIATAFALGIFGSVDMNRGDLLLGWDTDQFPNNVEDMVLPLYTILKNGGFSTGGLNFDAKVRRQSLDAVDLFHAHVGAIDVTARALLVAEKMIQDGKLAQAVKDRYQGWNGPLGKDILAGKESLESLAKRVLDRNQDVAPVSGRQEALENLVNRYF